MMVQGDEYSRQPQQDQPRHSYVGIMYLMLINASLGGDFLMRPSQHLVTELLPSASMAGGSTYYLKGG